MSYGLKIQNPTGGLVIDSAGFGMNYIGTATYYADVPYPRQSVSLNLDNAYSLSTATNVKEYRITSTSTALIPFIAIGTGTCELVDVSKIDENTWSISAYSNHDLEVFCFAKTSIVPTNYGMALYDTSGNLSYNFCNANAPLFFTSIGEFPDDTIAGSPVSTATITGKAISSYTKPAAFGWNLGYQVYNGPGSPPHGPPPPINTWHYTSVSSCGLTIYSNNLYRTFHTIVPGVNFDTGSDLPAGDNELQLPATTVVLIEASGLSV